MIRRTSAILIVFIFAMLAASTAFAADISRLGGGARSISLGKAYAGELGDANSMFINPAGLSGVNTFELSSMYVNLAGDVSYTLLSAAYPFRFGVVGVGYLGAFSGDLSLTTVESTGRIGANGVFNYSSNIMSVSYAGNPSDNLSLGLSGKYYSKGSPQVSGGNGSGMSVDIGAVYRMSDSLKIGLSGQNLLNTGIKWDGGITEAIPYNIKAGLAFKPNNRLSAMLDAEKTQGYDVLLRAGAEYKLRDELGLRIGAEQMQSGRGSSYWNYSGGIGLKIGEMRIDYAYYRDTLVIDNSSHFVSISIGFPGVAPRKDEKKFQELKEVRASAESAAPVIEQTPEARPIAVVTEKAIKITERSAYAVKEQRVRNYISLVDAKIAAYKVRGDTVKVKELRKEKQKTLNKWKAAKKKEISRKRTAKKISSGTSKKSSKKYVSKSKESAYKTKKLQKPGVKQKQRAIKAQKKTKPRPPR